MKITKTTTSTGIKIKRQEFRIHDDSFNLLAIVKRVRVEGQDWSDWSIFDISGDVFIRKTKQEVLSLYD